MFENFVQKYFSWASTWSIAKGFLREKLMSLRFCYFSSLLMNLGHNQQNHPILHSGGVSRAPCRLSAPLLPLTFRFPSAHLMLPFIICLHFLWTFFVDTFCWHFIGTPFIDTFCGHFLWTLFVDTFCWHFLWTLFVDNFCGHLCEHFFVETFL